jgi:hypothetical protein
MQAIVIFVAMFVPFFIAIFPPAYYVGKALESSGADGARAVSLTPG